MGNAYFLVVIGILLAKAIGFYRDMVFAGVFGTGVEADIYFQVFGLVNLIFTGIGVALSTLVIKNMNKAENFGKEKAYAAQFLRKSFMYLVAAALVMALFAKQIVGIILPELQGESLALAIRLTYVMLPSLVFVVIAYIVSGILQNEKVYFITAIMSLPFNLIIILALMMPEISVFTVGIVTTIGWFLHVAILLPAFYKKGYRFTKAFEKPNEKNGKNPEILWIFISNMMFQLCFYIDRAFVSTDPGMASTFNYASNLFITISSVFVVAMSTVVFPSISKNYEEGHIEYVNGLLQYIITIMAAIFLPFLLVVKLFGTDIIRLLYERGSFTAESTVAVSSIFFIYSLGILGYVSQELFNKVLYLAGKYKYSVTGTISVIAVNIITNVAIRQFVPDTPFAGTGLSNQALWISVSTALFLTCYAVLVAFAIRKVVGPYFKKELLSDLVKILLSGVLAIFVYFLFNTFLPDFTHGYITFIVPLGACGVVYLAALLVTGILKKLIKKEKKGEN
ncbi:MAG: hypothetical protein IJN39_07110 [Clostridia bacterium]|nr:hypothetical protein [Clostridia bacterium]